MERENSKNVCGLLFTTEDEPRVLLAKRFINDQWVYDGLGGPLRPDARMDGPQCQLSELVYAETGILTKAHEWTEIVNLRGDTWEVTFFFAATESATQAHSQGTDKADDISFENPNILPINIIPTMKWLIPLALDDNVHKPLGIAGITL